MSIPFKMRPLGLRPGLPVGFTELDYLEASGTQWIDTGIHPPCVATISFAWLSGGKSWCTWGVSGAYQNHRGAIWGVNNRDDDYFVRAYSVGLLGAVPLVSGQKNEMIHSLYETSFSFSINGAKYSYGVLSGDSLNPTNSYCFFGRTPISDRLYTATITDADGKIVLDLIPVLRNADGVAGMWDKVSKQFFENDGTGTFGYRIKNTGATHAPMSLRDPYYTAPSGVYARKAGENELEMLADTEETTGEGWEWFANTAEAFEHFGIEPLEEEFLTE